MDEKTIETYNVTAKEYDDETSNFWELFPPKIIEQFAQHTKGKVLDIGSGPGRDGLLLREKGLEVICLDASAAMVKLSSEKGLTSVQGDFDSLPFEDASFDGVWAYTSLLHIPKEEIDKPFREIVRVLKPNGTLGLGLIEGETEGYRESSGIQLPRWFSFYKKEEIEKLLAAHGFTLIYFNEFTPRSKKYLNFIAKKTF